MISAFTLSTAIFTLLTGHFIDRMNRMKILVPFLVLYGLIGLEGYLPLIFNYFYPKVDTGHRSSIPTAFDHVVLADVYKGHESLHAMSRVSIALAIGSASAPLIGGGLASFGIKGCCKFIMRLHLMVECYT